jgi:hypothetical protein
MKRFKNLFKSNKTELSTRHEFAQFILSSVVSFVASKLVENLYVKCVNLFSRGEVVSAQA